MLGHLAHSIHRHACLTKAFALPDVVIERASAGDDGTHQAASREGCDHCGLTALEWRKCKLVCTRCRQINESRADL
ncbi:MAG TPA: hypothetical protein VG963_18560 [Polyangiaceae bacterium]|nr:hypothetical protein [Polyangiaceae bacterium]